MTDEALAGKKLAEIETFLAELRSLARPERIEDDLRERRFIEHTLQLAIQATLDVASHVVSDERLGEPATNRELFESLAQGGWLAQDLAENLGRMAGFRNVLVHGYATVDLGIVREVVLHHLADLDAFVAAIRARMG